jgi:hypothetical protein
MLNDEKKVVEKQILARVFNIMQYEEYLSEEKIKQVLATYKTIKQFAYVKHDKDFLYSKSFLAFHADNDEDAIAKSKELKKPHFHIVLKFDVAINLYSVAKWFGIASNFIEIPKGRDAFIQCVQYLTHESKKEQDAEKHLYDDSEIKSNFDFRLELDNYKNKQIKSQFKNATGKKLEIRENVLKDGLRLSEIDSNSYVADMSALQLCRREYLTKYAELPKSRTNYFIRGGSGAGKSFSSKALAKALIDPNNTMRDNEVFFITGQGNAMFQGYDGQPVIIFDDIRSWDLLNYYNKNAGAIFNLFDTVPSGSEQNIKFGSVKLINTINIVNSIEKFEDFSETICFRVAESGVAEPDKQMYRRFPLFINIQEDGYDLFVNKQFFNPAEENYKAYLQYRNLGIKMGLIKAKKVYGNSESFTKLQNKHFEKAVLEHKKVVAKFEAEIVYDDDLQRQFDLEMQENDVIDVVNYEINSMSNSEKIQKEIFELEQKIVELKNSKKKNPF